MKPRNNTTPSTPVVLTFLLSFKRLMSCHRLLRYPLKLLFEMAIKHINGWNKEEIGSRPCNRVAVTNAYKMK